MDFDVNYVYWDLETSRDKKWIREIGAIKGTTGSDRVTFETLVRYADKEELLMNNNNNQDTWWSKERRKDAPLITEAWKNFIAFVDEIGTLKPIVLVGHNSNKHDVVIFKRDCSHYKIPFPAHWIFLDTWPLCRKLAPIGTPDTPGPTNHKLESMIRYITQKSTSGLTFHRALADAEHTKYLLEFLVNKEDNKSNPWYKVLRTTLKVSPVSVFHRDTLSLSLSSPWNRILDLKKQGKEYEISYQGSFHSLNNKSKKRKRKRKTETSSSGRSFFDSTCPINSKIQILDKLHKTGRKIPDSLHLAVTESLCSPCRQQLLLLLQSAISISMILPIPSRGKTLGFTFLFSNDTRMIFNLQWCLPARDHEFLALREAAYNAISQPPPPRPEGSEGLELPEIPTKILTTSGYSTPKLKLRNFSRLWASYLSTVPQRPSVTFDFKLKSYQISDPVQKYTWVLFYHAFKFSTELPKRDED